MTYLRAKEAAALMGFKSVQSLYDAKQRGKLIEGIHYAYTPTRGLRFIREALEAYKRPAYPLQERKRRTA